MQQDDEDTRRTSFGTAVDPGLYDRMRPGYPRRAVDWLVGSPGHPLRVLDLAAGTGKVTRVLLELGHDVVAVDPSAPMLSALQHAVRGHPHAGRVETVEGSAEDVPLADASVDAVVVGQAWHWMRPAAALAQVRRVLRPGGLLGLAWNASDPASPWATELDALTSGSGEGKASDAADAGWWPRVPAQDAVRERATFTGQHRLAGVDDVVALAATYSAVAVSDEREQVLEAVRRLAAPQAGADGSVVVPTLCHCFRYRLG